MRLPVEWIRDYVALDPSVDVDDVARRLTMAGLEVEERAETACGPVLDIKVTPNRGDCLSVLGVARELSAAYRSPLRPIDAAWSETLGEAAELTSVTIEAPDLCPRYAARIVRNVRVAPSPAWMQARLEAAGMRPINNVVDVTNYVMLETGQPLHAFDFDTLHGRRIVVRRALPGETITTLDGEARTLSAEMLVIADADRPVAVAGVMGGAETEMSERTSTVLIESAHFHWLSVRRTARALGMRTEASDRFSRVVDPEMVAAAAGRACHLVASVGAGDVVAGIVDVYPSPPEPRTLTIRPARTSQLLGFEVTAEHIADALGRLGFGTDPDSAKTSVLLTGMAPARVPSWRQDVVREIDLVEEVGRVLGYDHIPERLPRGVSTAGADSAAWLFAERIRDSLTAAGLQEVVSHSLLAPNGLEDAASADQRIGIRSALSAELSGLRRSLLPGLVEAIERNARRGQAPLAFFEIGHVFNRLADGYGERPLVAAAIAGPLTAAAWDKPARLSQPDYYLTRGIVERLAAALHLPALDFRPRTDDERLHPGRSADVWAHTPDGDRYLGYVGELHPNVTRELATFSARDHVIVFSLEIEALQVLAAAHRSFQPPTPYPAVTRDLAPRVYKELPFAVVSAAVAAANVSFLEECRLTDLYTGAPLPEDVKSLTLSLTFRASDRTLTDSEVNDALDRLRAALEAACGATFPA